VIEYSAIIAPALCKKRLKNLQIIQNNALRTILHVKKIEHLNIDELHRRAEICKLDVRLNELRKNYIEKAVERNNPLVKETISEYNRFKRRPVKIKTLLCDLEICRELDDISISRKKQEYRLGTSFSSEE